MSLVLPVNEAFFTETMRDALTRVVDRITEKL